MVSGRFIARLIATVKNVPLAPTSAPQMISSVELISKPVIATATPVKELSSEMTTGISAPPMGSVIATSSSVFSLLNGYLIAYVGIALVIAAFFALIKKMAGEKVVSSEVFGRSEFYLGMLAGMVRFSCMVIMGMALLNARSFNQAEIRADINYQNDVVIESFTTDVKVIARAASIWRRIEPTRNEIAVKGVKFLKKTLGK